MEGEGRRGELVEVREMEGRCEGGGLLGSGELESEWEERGRDGGFLERGRSVRIVAVREEDAEEEVPETTAAATLLVEVRMVEVRL